MGSGEKRETNVRRQKRSMVRAYVAPRIMPCGTVGSALMGDGEKREASIRRPRRSVACRVALLVEP